MASHQILILQGHPDPAGAHLCHALAQAYADGAREAGHGVTRLNVAELDFPLLRSQAEWRHGYRFYFRAHSLRSLERNILGFVGIALVHETLVGSVDQLGEAGVARWQAKLRQLGRQAA